MAVGSTGQDDLRDVVVVRRDVGPDSELANTLDAAGFDTLLRDLSREDGRIPVVSVLVGLGAVVFADPRLVGQLVDWILGHGARAVLLGAVPPRDRDLGWTVARLVDRCGLPDQAVEDPLADLAECQFPEQSVLHGRRVSRAWIEGDVRIVLAPCATDSVHGFVGCLESIGCVAPVLAGAAPDEVIADLVQHSPPDLAVLDATTISHGPVGTSVRRELRTSTLVVARSPLLTDIVAGSLLGLDPGVSATVSVCLAAVGGPARHRVVGDLSRLPGVVTPPTKRALPGRAGAGSTSLARVLTAAMAVDARVDAASGPAGGSGVRDAQAADSVSPTVVVAGPHDDADTVLAAVRALLAPWVTSAADSPGVAAALAAAQGGLIAAADAVDAWRTTFAKDSLTRVEAPLGIDLSAYRAADYEAVEDLLRPLVDQVDALPVTGDALRWQHLDGSVLFEVTRTVNAPYEKWVERVDVSQAIRLMADYLGGRAVVVARDRLGRPVRQAERNLYLPQPNYVAFAGGQLIDVCKLEVIRYHRDSREIWWQTVHSPNGSADYDDGTVEFADVGAGRTRIRIRGRQRFTLPLFWAVLDIDRAPGLRDVLTTDAYNRFFTATLDNLEACYEGRPFQIGRPAVYRPLPTKDIGPLLATARQLFEDWLRKRSETPTRPGGSTAADLTGGALPQWVRAATTMWASPSAAPHHVDDQGFRHFVADQRPER